MPTDAGISDSLSLVEDVSDTRDGPIFEVEVGEALPSANVGELASDCNGAFSVIRKSPSSTSTYTEINKKFR